MKSSLTPLLPIALEIVSARFLPLRLVLDTCDDVWIVDAVIEEALPLLDGGARVCKHVP